MKGNSTKSVSKKIPQKNFVSHRVHFVYFGISHTWLFGWYFCTKNATYTGINTVFAMQLLDKLKCIKESYCIFRHIRRPPDKMRYKIWIEFCTFIIYWLYKTTAKFLHVFLTRVTIHLLRTNAHFFLNIDAILLLFSDLCINAHFAILPPN